MCGYYGCDCKHCENNKDWKACKYVEGIPIYKIECFNSVCPHFRSRKNTSKIFKTYDKAEKWIKTTFAKYQVKYYLISCFFRDYIFDVGKERG